MNFVQAYHMSADRRDFFGEYHGFGDHLRGCIYLTQQCERLGIKLHSSYIDHKLRFFLRDSGVISSKDIKRIQRLRIPDSFNSLSFEHDPVVVFSNKFPERQITAQDIDSVNRVFLSPTDLLLEELENVYAKLRLVRKGYDVLHIRMGDEALSDDSVPSGMPEFLSRWRGVKCQFDKPTIIMSDSRYVLAHEYFRDFLTTNLRVGHFGLENTSIDEIRGSIIEFFLIMNAKALYQYSVYKWGSGFSQWASVLGGVAGYQIRSSAQV